MTQRDEVEMLTDLTTVNVEPPLEDDVHMQGFGIAGAIELVKYEQRHKTWSHLRLAIGKNVALKRRRPKVCIFEVLLPPIFVVLISVGYYAADLWDHPAADYMPQPYMNTTTSIRNSLCVHGLPEGYRNPNDFQLCSGCPYRIVDIASEPGTEWPGGVPPVLCGTLNVNGLIEFVRLFVNMTSPSDVPTLDTLIAVQKSYAELSGFFGSLGGVPSVVNALMRTGNLEFARGSGVTCAEAQSLIAGLRARSLLFDLVFQPNATNDPACPGVWADEYTAVRYIKGDGADTTWALVVLGQADAGNSQFDFTIRMNNSATPSTNSKQASFTQGLGAKPYLQYTTSGFVTLQTAISAVLSDVPTASFITCPMPTEAYKESEFFDQVSQLLPLYLTLAFIYPVNRLVAAIVLEKEDRQREGMLIMGLSRGSFYLSWYLTYAAVGTVSTIIIVVYTHNNLFSQSSPLLVFVLFEAFSLSIVAFSLLISVFFSKARIAAVAAPIFMMLTTLPRNIVDRDTVTPSGQHWLSLVSPSAFGYGIGLMCDYEGSGAGASFDDFTSGDYSFASSVFMMIVDTVLYLAVAWYLDNVLPSEWGVKKHPLFLCQPSYWRRSTERKVAANDQPPPAPNYEKFDPVTAAAMRERERVVITDMTKTFSGKKGPAVNHVGSGFPEDSIAFHEGQIQVILGHNGAGKTTLINMLTGMLQPDTGDCRVWGKSVLRDMDAIRGDLGLCPQHNILWPLLSCREHLLFFGGLKGTPRDKLAVLADQMLDLINLGSKKDAPASSLSGGQKRKLSVAISLIGGPKLVFLDEPTAGMDVESRRAMWHLLRRPDILRNRCIVLTTHYMDEADLLGDSVMIMDRGAVHSMGSPFFLKQNLGVGYNLTLAMQQGGSPEAVERAICGVVPNARFLSTSGNELKFQVPTHLPLTDELIEGAFLGLSASDSPASAADEAAHLELPAAAKLSAVDALLASPESDRLELALFLQKNVETADHTKRALGSLLEDCRAQAVFPALFNKLDAEKQALRVESYGIGVTTLEEVFMKIALGGADGDQEKVTGNKGRVVGEGSRDFKLYSIAAPGASPVRGVRLQWMQLKALMLKRMHSGRRDLRTLFYQFGSPVLFVLAALMLARIEPPDQSKILLGVSQFDVPLSTPVSQPAAGSDLLGPCLDHLATCPFPPLLSMVNATTMGSIPLSAYLLSSYFSHEATQRPVALAAEDSFPGLMLQDPADIPPSPVTILHNATYLASLPSALGIVSDAFVKLEHGPAAYLRVHNHPLPMSDYMSDVVKSILLLVTSIFILMPFTLLPANYVSFVVKERECKAKNLQIVSGASVSAYWVAAFCFDIVAYLCTLSLVFILFFADSREEFVGSGAAFAATFVLFFTYGVSSVVSSYAVSFLFTSHTQAQSMVSTANVFTGVILVLGSFILDKIESTAATNEYLKYGYRVIPSYCLGEGILALSTRVVQTAITGTEAENPLAWGQTGVDVVFMLASVPLYALVIAGIEAYPAWKGAWARAKEARNAYHAQSVTSGESCSFGAEAEDSAVAEERRAILEGRPGDLVTVKNLRKVWPKATVQGKGEVKVAVKDLTFGVKKGELFAFLGTNGAGKTTTLSVISGEYLPTSGSASIGYNPETGEGYDICSDRAAAQRNLGLCPQFDALLELVTPEEHLRLFAALRGIPAEFVEESVETLIAAFGLQEYRGLKSRALSGGNKRKLSVALALVGGPPVIFLDEPSAGMDPVARRALWRALEDACKDRCVVLTTHHLEEVEGLSHLPHRVTIMVDGSLQCLGSLQQVKSNFGDAYELELKVDKPENEAAVRSFVSATYPNSTLQETTTLRLTYKIPKPVSLASVFGSIEANRGLGITDYSINETSLEQVFIRISERATRDDEQDAGDHGDEASRTAAAGLLRAPPLVV